MKKNKQRKGFYLTVVRAILEGVPFDITKDTHSFTKVSQLITFHILRELTDADRLDVWKDWLVKVEGVLDFAIRHINETTNYHVLKFKRNGTRNNEFLSLCKNGMNPNEDCREGRERNADRVMRNAEITYRAARKEILKTIPNKLPELTRKLLLNGTTENLKQLN